MADAERRAQIAERVQQRRRELLDRPDISQRMRKLSESSGRHPKGPMKRKRSTTLTLLLGAGAVMAMLLCVATAAMVLAGNLWVQAQLGDPTVTVQNYYSALGQQNYQTAYSYLSKRAQSKTSEAHFADTYSSLDSVDGIIQQHIVTSSKVASDSATIKVTLVRRGREMAQTQTLQLVKDSGDWRIDAITQGPDVPVPTITP